jgi:putative membrane protein
LVTAAVWRLLQGGRGGPSSRGSDESPLQILQQRYARGEIDRDEYEEKKRDLGYFWRADSGTTKPLSTQTMYGHRREDSKGPGDYSNIQHDGSPLRRPGRR